MHHRQGGCFSQTVASLACAQTNRRKGGLDRVGRVYKLPVLRWKVRSSAAPRGPCLYSRPRLPVLYLVDLLEAIERFLCGGYCWRHVDLVERAISRPSADSWATCLARRPFCEPSSVDDGSSGMLRRALPKKPRAPSPMANFGGSRP